MDKERAIGLVTMVAFVITTSLANGQNHEVKKEGLNHIKLVKEKNGERVELDTFVEPGAVFVWQGDSIGKAPAWVSNKGESHTYNLEMANEDGKKKMMVFSSSKTMGAPSAPEAAVWISSEGDRFNIHSPRHPEMVVAAYANSPKVSHGGNIINLSDPGIISYKKKKLSGGREKVIVIRNETDDSFLPDLPGLSGEMPGPKPAFLKDIRVFKGNRGEFHVMEGNGETINIEEIHEGDGKVIKVIVSEGKKEQETENNEGGN